MTLSSKTLLAPLFALIFLASACKNDDNKKMTCVKIKDLAEFEKITWEQVGTLEAQFDTKADKEIMGKTFGEQHYCTLVARIKNTSCFTSNFTVKFQLVTFSEKDLYDSKTKQIKPGEEVEFKSLPFEVKNMDDVSDKSVDEVQTDYIHKKVKVTYEKDCVATEKNCRCDAPNDDTDNSKMLTVKAEDALRCEEDVKAVVVGQIAGAAPKNTEGDKKSAKKKVSDAECDTHLDKPTTATVTTSADDLFIRSAANSDADVVGRAPKGAKVKVSCYSKKTAANGQNGRWAKVKYGDTEGWAWEAFLSF